jgi:hypothetical protein
MIELLPNMPLGVTGVRVSGRLGGDEVREIKPTIFKLDELERAKDWAAG